MQPCTDSDEVGRTNGRLSLWRTPPAIKEILRNKKMIIILAVITIITIVMVILIILIMKTKR